MKIAVIGYGNMGKEIERVINESGHHEIVSISYKTGSDGLDIQGIKNADVAIDFTSPEIVIENIHTIIPLGIPLVVGTTGWYEQLPEISTFVTAHKGSLVYGQNFSIGANIFFNIVEYASKLVEQYKEYDIFGVETHHRGKKDSPSGTAKRLSEIMLQNITRKKRLMNQTVQGRIDPEDLHFVSVRGGHSFGKHDIIFDSESDEIQLTHQAWNRRGFAEGAVVAAEFSMNRKGIYNFAEVFLQKGKYETV